MIGLLGSLLGSRGGSMLGGMIGGRTGAMIGGMAGALIGGRKLGGALNGLKDLVDGDDNEDGAAAAAATGSGEPLSEAEAELLIRAMANAAKADGRVDQSEIDAILGELRDATTEEQRFLSDELAAPFIDASTFAAAVPAGLAADAYVVSVAAVRVDSTAETAYLRDLAAGMGIDHRGLESIHDQLGIPRI